MVEIEQIQQDQIPAVQQMMKEYLAYAFSLEQGSENAPTFEGVDQEMNDLPGIFSPPRGRFYVATFEGRLSGFVALKPIDNETCELKRLFVRPTARGQNLGTQLVNRLIRDARAIGYQKIILDSHKKMVAAHTIYRMAGFKDVPAPADFPEALKPVVVFMERDLATI